MLAQLLIGISFSMASYQDVKDRAVHDIVWIPALLGALYVIYSEFSTPGPDLELQLFKLGLIGGIALLFVYFGAVGQADGIALAFVAADPYRYSPVLPLAAAAVVALAHIGYEIVVGNAPGPRTITIERFLREQKWIPRAILKDGSRVEVDSDVNVARDEVEAKQQPGTLVEVKYGVPTVAYLGVGYVAYLVYLVAFNQATLFSLA
ncbi:MAG: hypothetical protein HY296_01640 [Thaumarchaeota archaeon]|nr:hypothetical protein [Nitrososphaerota archaeon]